MKAIIPVLLAILVGVANIPLIYGFKKAYSQNPFIFAGSFNLCSAFLFIMAGYLYGGIEQNYFLKNWPFIIFAAVGVFSINIMAYIIINRYGASYWLIASLSAMLIPALFVGYYVFKERLNLWIIPSVLCAILTVFFFILSKK
ncbi:MAG: hypothetical protein JW882_11480 [Deltaproteobacteria bacterium]|nr:hypothetical protein [Deltaproteobacteria bacterium]